MKKNYYKNIQIKRNYIMKIRTKRIIAQMLSAMFISSAITASTMSVIQQRNLQDDINKLDIKLSESYTNVVSSQDFTQQYLTDCQKHLDDYSNGVITFEQCNDKLSYFQSPQYIDDYITSHASDYQDIINANSNQQTLKQNYDNLLKHSAIGTTGLAVGSLVSVLCCGSLKSKEEDFQY